MKNVFKLKYTMYLVLIDYINTNKTKFEVIPGFIEKFELFVNAVNIITENKPKQLVDNSGNTKKKNELRNELTSITLGISKKIYAYAVYKNLDELKSKSKYVKSDFTKVEQNEFIDLCVIIYDLGKSILTELESFGISSTDYDIFKSKIDLFKEKLPLTTKTKVIGKETTGIINDSFTETDNYITEMDALVEVISDSNPVIYKSYKESRKLINVGVTTLAFKAKVLDAESKTGVANAKVSMHNNESGEKINKKSSPKGGIKINNMSKGVFEIKVEKLGYKTQNLSVNIITGETTEVEILLEKE